MRSYFVEGSPAKGARSFFGTILHPFFDTVIPEYMRTAKNKRLRHHLETDSAGQLFVMLVFLQMGPLQTVRQRHLIFH